MVYVGELFLLKAADGYGVQHATVSKVCGDEIKVSAPSLCLLPDLFISRTFLLFF